MLLYFPLLPMDIGTKRAVISYEFLLAVKFFCFVDCFCCHEMTVVIVLLFKEVICANFEDRIGESLFHYLNFISGNCIVQVVEGVHNNELGLIWSLLVTVIYHFLKAYDLFVLHADLQLCVLK